MEKPRVLLADDNHEMRGILLEMLSEFYDVSVVCTGKELYTLMSERRELYSAVVCDIVMPHWNGDEAVKMAQAFGSSVPVLFISGDDESIEEISVDQCHYLVKPIRREPLLEKLREMIVTGR